jgi:hypothetical protein
MLRISPNKNPGARVEALIRAGAESLFTQHRHSIGYLLGGADDIVETNIVLHIGSAFLSQGHAVWAESPFKVDGEKSVKHLDLLIDLDPGLSDTASVLLVEAKRLRSLDGTESRFSTDAHADGYRKDGPVSVAKFEFGEDDETREDRALRQRQVSELIESFLAAIDLTQGVRSSSEDEWQIDT